MQIAEVMTPDCIYCAEGDSVSTIARMMAENDVGAIPVARNDSLVGVITDRDIVTRCIANGGDPNSAGASTVMSDQVLYCFNDQDTQEVAKNMAEMQVRRLPVVNREKRLVGMVSLGDLATHAPKDQAATALKGVAQVPS